MIEKLQWDSEKFGLEIGKFQALDKQDLIRFSGMDKSDFDLIYIFCSPSLSESERAWFSEHKLSLLDRRQNFKRPVLANEKTETNPNIRPVSSISAKLLDLTFQSGSHSRLKPTIGWIRVFSKCSTAHGLPVP